MSNAAANTASSKKTGSRRRRGAAHTVAEECERLFCGTLGAVFLGEGGRLAQRPLATGAHYNSYGSGSGSGSGNIIVNNGNGNATMKHGLVTPGQSPEVTAQQKMGIGMESVDASDGGMLIQRWIEMFDYAGGARFRGFIAEREGEGGERAMFVFFDDSVLSNDLKPGLMDLLELCEIPEVDCSKLVTCVDRHAPAEQLVALTRDLGWVGFEPYTLVDWTQGDDILSDAWLFLSMDV